MASLFIFDSSASGTLRSRRMARRPRCRRTPSTTSMQATLAPVPSCLSRSSNSTVTTCVVPSLPLKVLWPPGFTFMRPAAGHLSGNFLWLVLRTVLRGRGHRGSTFERQRHSLSKTTASSGYLLSLSLSHLLSNMRVMSQALKRCCITSRKRSVCLIMRSEVQ